MTEPQPCFYRRLGLYALLALSLTVFLGTFFYVSLDLEAKPRVHILDFDLAEGWIQLHLQADQRFGRTMNEFRMTAVTTEHCPAEAKRDLGTWIPKESCDPLALAPGESKIIYLEPITRGDLDAVLAEQHGVPFTITFNYTYMAYLREWVGPFESIPGPRRRRQRDSTGAGD